MEDEELQRIRAQRLQQLQNERKGGGSVGGQQTQPGQEAEEAKQQQQQKEDEFRNTILIQILDQQARARLNTLKAAKPDKAKRVEDILIQNARMGVIAGKLGESDLIRILEQINQQFSKETKVIYNRRRANLDSSDED